MLIRRQYFGWYCNGAFYLSNLPPDAPIRRSQQYDSIDEIRALLKRRGVQIVWSPPLPDAIRAELARGLRVNETTA